MRQVSEKDLARLRTRGGVKVRRRRSEKLEPDTKGARVLSGTTDAQVPAPASEDLSLLLGTMTDVLVRLEERNAPEASEVPVSILTQAKRQIDEEEEQERLFDKRVDEVVAKKLKSRPKVDSLRTVSPSKKAKTPWKHVVERDELGYMKQFMSVDGAGNTWTHDVQRDDTHRIQQVISTDGAGNTWTHGVLRRNELIREVVST